MKAPAWLRESFRDGVDERQAEPLLADVRCWLADHDPLRRPCVGPLERFHFIPRKDVKRTLGNLLPWGIAGTDEWNHFADLIQIAEWDDRNGGIACERHHRRFDSHLTPRLVVPRSAVPRHVLAFVDDYGIESAYRVRFPELINRNRASSLSAWKV